MASPFDSDEEAGMMSGLGSNISMNVSVASCEDLRRCPDIYSFYRETCYKLRHIKNDMKWMREDVGELRHEMESIGKTTHKLKKEMKTLSKETWKLQQEGKVQRYFHRVFTQIQRMYESLRLCVYYCEEKKTGIAAVLHQALWNGLSYCSTPKRGPAGPGFVPNATSSPIKNLNFGNDDEFSGEHPGRTSYSESALLEEN